MSNELVEIQQENVLTVFSSVKGLDPIIGEITALVDDFEHDLSTGAGRKRTASLANKVAKSKTYIDNLGKNLVADWKSKAKVVDAERKRMRDTLDDLKQVARKPLTEWETEQEAIEAEKLAKAEAEKLAIQIEADHEMATLLNDNIDRELAIQTAAAEAKRLAEIERIKAEAAAAAKLQAEQEAANNLARMEREKQDAIDREAKARQDAINAQNRANEAAEREKQQAIQTERNRLAQIEADKQRAEQARLDKIESDKQAKLNAEAAAENARLAEVKRHQDEVDQLKAEQERKDADKRHVHGVKTKAMNDFIKAGLDEASARLAVKALAANSIRNCNINY